MCRSTRCEHGWSNGRRIGGGRARLRPFDQPQADLFDRLRAAESIGRPVGDDRFLAGVERLTGRSLKPRKRGPKPADN